MQVLKLHIMWNKTNRWGRLILVKTIGFSIPIFPEMQTCIDGRGK